MTRTRRARSALAFAVGVAVASTFAPTVADANDVVNGDFETGDTAGWNIYGGDVGIVDGAACLDVAAGTGPYGAAFQQRVRLRADTDYRLTLQASVPSGTPASVTAVVQLPRDPYTGYLPPAEIADQLTVDGTDFAWSFRTPAELPPADPAAPDGPNASLEVQHTAATDEPYRLCLDDVVLAGGDDQVVNGGFDDGLTGWTIAYPDAFVDDQGQGCIAVPAGTGAYGAGLGQLVTLEPETDYAYSFTAHLTEGSGTPGPIRAVVQLPRDPYSQYLPEQAIAAQLTNEPQSFRFDFTTPADLPPATDGGDPAGPHAEMIIQQNGATTAAYTLCIDDVSLVGGSEPEPYEPDTGPRVRVNHVGYFTDGPKRATLVTDVVTPVEWMLLDATDAVVATGWSTPIGVDESAGLDVHTIGFDDVTAVGDDYVLVADGERSHPFDVGVDDVYERLRHDALNYYYPARSGIEIEAAIAGDAYARPAGHIGSAGDGEPNEGDLGVGCQSIANQTNDAGVFHYGSEWACPDGYALDVVGGWYDAGDHGKYVVNGGISVAQLMSIVERSKTATTATPAELADGTLAVPERANGVPDVLDEARWELEWMMAMQVPAGSGAQLIDGAWIEVDGMVHHKVHDEGWTGLPLMPHLDPQPRSLHRPSTAATLNFAAVAAQGSRLWASYDPDFATDLLDRGRIAYEAALEHPAVHAPAADGAEGGGPYDDDDVADEFYWAAAELYITTGEPHFRDDLLASPLHDAPLLPDDGGFGWSDVAALGKIDLATVPNDLRNREGVRADVVVAADELLAVQSAEPFGHPYAGDEDGEYVWGSNSQVLNNMVVMAVAFDLTGDDRYRAGVMEGMDYLLGRNALGWSYVTGYGEAGYNSVNQHSRWWAAQLDPSLPNPPPGTISGGPNSFPDLWDPVAQSLFAREGCAPQRCYVDDIGSWSTNELTINWNAPMAWIANFLADQDDSSPVEAPTCRVQVREVAHVGDLTLLRLRIRDDDHLREWTLDWSWLGGESVLWATGVTATQAGPDVRLASSSPWWRRGSRSTTTFVLVDERLLAVSTPERFELSGEHCTVTRRPSGWRWW